jgi:hypothetical protein
VATEVEARARVLKVLDDAKTFEDLRHGLLGGEEFGAAATASEDAAFRFIFKGDPSGLDGELEERFAQVLSRFVESREAMHLAGMLEVGKIG